MHGIAPTARHQRCSRRSSRLDGLSPPEQVAALTEVMARVLSTAGVAPQDQSFMTFLEVFLQVLPGRLRAITSERAR
jgi:hypothetical protein